MRWHSITRHCTGRQPIIRRANSAARFRCGCWEMMRALHGARGENLATISRRNFGSWRGDECGRVSVDLRGENFFESHRLASIPSSGHTGNMTEFNQPASGLVVPRFGGIATFMRLPHVPLEEAKDIELAWLASPGTGVQRTVPVRAMRRGRCAINPPWYVACIRPWISFPMILPMLPTWAIARSILQMWMMLCCGLETISRNLWPKASGPFQLVAIICVRCPFYVQ